MDGGHLAAQHAPKNRDSCMGWVVDMYFLDLQGRYRGGHVQYCRPLQMTVYCTYRRSSRRPAGRRGMDSIFCPPRRGCNVAYRTQALSSAEKELEPFPFERNMACYSLSRPTTHGCHVPLTAWVPKKVPESAGVCAVVRPFVQRRVEKVVSTYGRVVISNAQTAGLPLL